MIGAEHRRRLQEGHTVGNPIAYKEIGQGRDREIAEDFRQCIDLVLLPDRSHFKKRKAGVHGQDHDCAEQDEQRIGAVDQTVHGTLHIFHGIGRPEKVEKSTKPVRLPCERTKLKRLIGRT
ncbi:hypothetical protein D3C76_1529870 [compost metagenome]